jgi:hypothetical protein
MANLGQLPDLDAGWFADAALDHPPLSPSLADIFKSDGEVSGAESGMNRSSQVLRPSSTCVHAGPQVRTLLTAPPGSQVHAFRHGPPGDYASFQQTSSPGALPTPQSPHLQQHHLSPPQSIPAPRPGTLQQQQQQQQRQSPTATTTLPRFSSGSHGAGGSLHGGSAAYGAGLLSGSMGGADSGALPHSVSLSALPDPEYGCTPFPADASVV